MSRTVKCNRLHNALNWPFGFVISTKCTLSDADRLSDAVDSQKVRAMMAETETSLAHWDSLTNSLVLWIRPYLAPHLNIHRRHVHERVLHEQLWWYICSIFLYKSSLYFSPPHSLTLLCKFKVHIFTLTTCRWFLSVTFCLCKQCVSIAVTKWSALCRRSWRHSAYW